VGELGCCQDGWGWVGSGSPRRIAAAWASSRRRFIGGHAGCGCSDDMVHGRCVAVFFTKGKRGKPRSLTGGGTAAVSGCGGARSKAGCGCGCGCGCAAGVTRVAAVARAVESDLATAPPTTPPPPPPAAASATIAPTTGAAGGATGLASSFMAAKASLYFCRRVRHSRQPFVA
jgi:hypothetical protein